ncbi:DUF2029 domain-containing protein [Paenarthrobacter sp. Z7-10]|uniref:glycosyltransferase family 87 protein n=1 Tax=Paenarthrobacter sp. Z7-10 TaxID=2787635 RepID=UPI0022A951A5|nr:glycosyltransferase 87 family protein [Paenarthrobacter sp. Z7-10]MCZ2401715.1 DUF2029 domain-containing protein [Paenarthrobacter sp. Z7-10]
MAEPREAHADPVWASWFRLGPQPAIVTRLARSGWEDPAGMLKTMEDFEQLTRRRVGIVSPSRGDSLLRRMTEVVGGPLGRRTAPGIVEPAFFTVERVLTVLVIVSGLLALLFKFHCRQVGWSTPDQYSTTCWSELPNAFKAKGLAGSFPYFSPGSTFNYPVLIGAAAGITAWLTGPAGHGMPRQLAFFDLNAGLIIGMWLAAVVATSRSARRRPWDAAILALSPVLLFTALTSWDMWAVALVAVGMLLFARRRTFSAGAVLGLASCAQPYAMLILLAVLLLSLRTGRWLPFLETAAAAAAAALALTLPILVLNPASWLAYFTDRMADAATPSSLYGAYNLVAQRLGHESLTISGANSVEIVFGVLILLATAWLVLAAPRRPRMAQLAFLLVAGYSLVDKHAVPQHVVWLIPLLALARPKWRTALLWQCFQILQFLAWQLFLGRELGDGNAQHSIDMPYFVLAAALGGIATLVVMALVIRDIVHPAYDVVRRAGADDPQGGLLERSPDRLILPLPGRARVT